MTNENQWLQTLKEDDRVIVESSYYRGKSRVEKVTRVTATQIVVGKTRYRRDTGREMGATGYYGRDHLRPATPDAVRKIQQDMRRSALARKLDDMNWKEVPLEVLETISGMLEQLAHPKDPPMTTDLQSKITDAAIAALGYQMPTAQDREYAARVAMAVLDAAGWEAMTARDAFWKSFTDELKKQYEVRDEKFKRWAQEIAKLNDGGYDGSLATAIDLLAAALAQSQSAFDGLAEQCQMLRRDLGEERRVVREIRDKCTAAWEDLDTYRAHVREQIAAVRTEIELSIMAELDHPAPYEAMLDRIDALAASLEVKSDSLDTDKRD